MLLVLPLHLRPRPDFLLFSQLKTLCCYWRYFPVPQLTTLTLLRFNGATNRAWIFTQMGLMPGWFNRSPVAGVAGLRFSRLLGSGAGNGFGLAPNFGVYAWLGHWETEEAADDFFSLHPWWQAMLSHSSEQLTARMLPTMTHGEWGGDRPFSPRPEDYDPSRPVAVITRATIRTRKLPDFWRYVPQTSASIEAHPARKLSIGVGEYPVFMQATFSLWTSGKAMQEFAYRSQHHKEVVRLTRERNWYKEEMFTRFQVLALEGNWEGQPATEWSL
ncbi:hypothetical protein [Neolewinella agarilytica]|uniref:hypothetical protein n=1 Tax=Neolewinella agarilytica TaxID=478744 RepID=UPI002356D8D1|nr:hypothetical protein [Neolewinella agarilytica]